MSEVYIRSQNKEKLYRLGGNYACVEYGEYEDVKKKRGGAEADKKRHVICISDGCLEEIGEYATKERCLEVLDEIQKACVHGKGGEAGIKAIQQLAGMVDSLKQCQTPQEVYDRYLQITGYCKCCVDCNFIDQKGADELMCLAAYLAGNEQARAETQQKAGKKA